MTPPQILQELEAALRAMETAAAWLELEQAESGGSFRNRLGHMANRRDLDIAIGRFWGVADRWEKIRDAEEARPSADDRKAARKMIERGWELTRRHVKGF